MQKQNVTLSLPRDLLRQAKIVAIERDTSLSGLLAETLQQIVYKHRKYEDARHVHETLLTQSEELGLNDKISWSRDDLYGR